MSYNISQRSVIEFINDSDIKLPRFQRKSTWKPGQGFELIISMAKEYPMGVVVINREQGNSWLLDGRQRLSALKDFRNDPNRMYDAAKSYLKFNDRTTDEELKDLFWKGVESYLVNISPDTSDADNDDSIDEAQEGEANNIEEFESGIDRDRQQEGLKTLLDVIRIVHVRKKDRISSIKYGSWERLFKLDEYLTNLPYQLKKEGYVINPIQLRKYLLELGADADEKRTPLSQDYFIDKVDEMIKDGKRQDFKDYVYRHWQEMANVIEVIVRSEKIFRNATIGVIMIQNVTPLDAQNIFTKINKGGSPLTTEELNSAKPFWNEPMYGYSPEVDVLVRKLYKRLNISTDGKVVKWDLAATLIHRIKDFGLIFEKYGPDIASSSKLDSFTDIGIGFKLISSFFTKGISKVKINSLENCKDMHWPQSIDDFVIDFNYMCNVLKEDRLFSRLILWKRPLIKLIGESATYEFCSILLSEWKKLGSPQVNGAQRNTFYRNARVLFDTLVYECATGFWKGTGDAKMSNHVKSSDNRFKPKSQEMWDSLIEDLCTTGQFNGSLVSKSNIEPLVYYQFVLREVQNPMNADNYEIDHIIPKSIIKDNRDVPEWFIDSLVNLSLLSDIDNNAKKDRRLSDIKGTSLGNIVSKFIGIEESEYDRYSDMANLGDFIESRKDLLKDTFKTKRQSLLAN